MVSVVKMRGERIFLRSDRVTVATSVVIRIICAQQKKARSRASGEMKSSRRNDLDDADTYSVVADTMDWDMNCDGDDDRSSADLFSSPNRCHDVSINGFELNQMEDNYRQYLLVLGRNALTEKNLERFNEAVS
jgi:hypothetical protein